MFSVIVSTYNGSKEILNTLENIKRGLEGFRFEIIVVDDGSIDDTAILLEPYKKDKRFKILKQSNQGISAARNQGIEAMSQYAQYVVFIDDSDKVAKNFFLKIDNYFNTYADIDIVATPLIRTKNGIFQQHSLNYRFHAGKQIVDIHNDYQYIQFHIGGMAFRKRLFDNQQYRFDENLTFWEDAKFINNILIDIEKYGLISDTAYFYNSENPNSLSKSAWFLEERYIPLIENNYMFLIRKSNEKFNHTIPYVQFLIATHYSEYLKEHNQERIIENPYFNVDRFELASQRLFSNISSEIIYNLRTHHVYINYMLNLKGKSVERSRLVHNFKIHIHTFNILTRNIKFSFSDPTATIPIDSKVYLNCFGNHLKLATLVKTRRLNILGKPTNDFSKNIYKIKLPLIYLFIRSKMTIVKNEIEYEIYNPSILSRVVKNVQKLIKHRRK
ncbi:glycosyltransferase family 2 protein [Staphylococcus americanisciuri]|uniref:Putative glycosyltransferase TagX n=1 Tax=Staphylococcus americanisciuri TaxID=2973940 RepID=A0ABT2F3U7_9STAP|nr:glycosyltransferase family 2 protein [Staphylococcus americanisciuri]MCS4487149.1 glycosyltransferase [Staphylococcus americanisciuri]